MTSNFRRHEFACPCCGADNISEALVDSLQIIRDHYGPMTITSGVRCLERNRKLGSKDNSAHVSGEAADISCTSSKDRHRLVSLALRVGFQRIGIAKGFIHLDISDDLPHPVIWTY